MSRNFRRDRRRSDLSRRRLIRAMAEALEPRILLSNPNVLYDFSGNGPDGGVVIDSKGDLYGATHGGGPATAGTIYEIENGSSSISILATSNESTGVDPQDLALDSRGNVYGIDLTQGVVGLIFELASGSSSIQILPQPNGINGESPDGVVLDSSGNIYFSTLTGGANLDGVVDEIPHGSSSIITLASFNGTNGAKPLGVTVDSAGNLFGTTRTGGANNDGTIFELAAGSGSITSLFSFNSPQYNYSSSVIPDTMGDLFGTVNNLLFELPYESLTLISLATWNPVDDSYPFGLVLDSSGNLYGESSEGYGATAGTVFEMVDGADSITTLATFNIASGTSPAPGLALDSSGNLYGTTENGGANNFGAVFELAAGSGTISTIASFNGGVTAFYPGASPVVLDSQGDIFVATRGGGIYELSEGGSSLIQLASFNGEGALGPVELISDNAGNLYGITGTDSGLDGTIFELASGSSSIVNLYSFNASNSPGNVSLVADSDGNLFGITQGGGADGAGSIFELPAASRSFVTLASFNGANGWMPMGDLVESNGNIYGTTQLDGPNYGGTVFELSAGSSSITTLAGFNDSNQSTTGFSPYTGVVLDSAGDIYGTTAEGGTGSNGTIFEIPNGSSSILTLASFSAWPADQTFVPQLNLAIDTNGNLYGTSIDGGDYGHGSVYVLPRGGNSVSTLASFNGFDGAGLMCGLTVGASGMLYGTAALGGSVNGGVLYDVPAINSDHLVILQQPSNATAGAASAPAVTITLDDQNNNISVSDNSIVTLSLTNASGSLVGITATAIAVNGIATFSDLAVDTSGLYSFIASDASDSSLITSDLFAISPAAPSQMAFIQQPTNATAGSNINPAIIVAVEDTDGNIVSGDNVTTVTLSINTGPGSTLTGTVTATVSAGQATFGNVSEQTAGTYTLVAFDGAPEPGGITSGASSSFVISPNVPTQLGPIILPVNVTGGHPFTAEFAVEDTYGNVTNADDFSVVTVYLSDLSGPYPSLLTGTTTARVVNGVSTFSNLEIPGAGQFMPTLSAIDSQDGIGFFQITLPLYEWVYLPIQNSPAGLQPTLTIVSGDAGIQETQDNSSVATLSIASGPGTFASGSTTTCMAVNGVFTFSNLILETAGTYSLFVSDPSDGVADLLSPTFVVSPGLNFVQIPTSPVYPGEPLAGSPNGFVISIIDQNNSVVTGDNTSTVTLLIATGPGAIPTFGDGDATETATVTNGVATFSTLYFTTPGTYTFSATDTKDDITSGPVSAPLVVAANSSLDPAANLVFSTIANSTAGAKVPSFTVTLEDPYLNVATTDDSIVTLTKDVGPGTVGGALTAQAINGVATFSDVVLTTAGTYALYAADAQDEIDHESSNNFTISIAASDKLAFVQQPGNAIAGATFNSVEVAVEDSFGNLEPGNISIVTLSLNTTSATLGGALTADVVNGIATFSDLSLTKAGTYTITATDGSLLEAASNNFVVAPQAANHLAILRQPTNGTAGVTFSSIVVAVEDTFGNIETTDGSVVDLSFGQSPSGAALFGSISVAATAGIATFNNLFFTMSGSYTLTASDSSLTGATSNGFVIAPARASQLVILEQPSNITAGSPAPIVFAVEDSFGNVVSNDISTATASVLFSNGASIAAEVPAIIQNGIATFGAGPVTVNTYSIVLTDGSLDSATSVSFVVSPNVASQLVITNEPSNSTAGGSIGNVVISLEDADQNLATGDDSVVTVALANAPSGVTLRGTLTAAVVNGEATFGNLFLTKAGTYSLFISDGSLPGITSDSLVNSPGAAHSLVITKPPVNTTAGAPFTVTIAVEDSFGNISTGDTSSITLTISDKPGAIQTTSVMAINGIATFSALAIDLAGTYTISAMDANLKVGSTAFTIKAAAPEKLVFTTPPHNAAQGSLPTIIVGVEDQFGNVCTTASVVSLSLASKPSGGVLGETAAAAASNGRATFSGLRLSLEGTYELAAKSGALSAATSGAFVVSTNVTSKLAFVQQPASGGQGSLQPFKVAVENSLGEVIYSDASTVTISLNAIAGATTSGTLTGALSVKAINGIATFANLALAQTGTWTLSATDSAHNLRATSIRFSIMPPSKVALLTIPSAATHGGIVSPVTVAVEASDSGLDSLASSTITLSILTGPSGASLAGTLKEKAINGIATFSNLSFNVAGTYTLEATDGSLTNATSSHFVIS